MEKNKLCRFDLVQQSDAGETTGDFGEQLDGSPDYSLVIRPEFKVKGSVSTNY